MTAPTVDPLQLIDDLDGDPDDLGHFPCEACGDDEPLHVICGAPIRGFTAKPGTLICGYCITLGLAGIWVCQAHGRAA